MGAFRESTTAKNILISFSAEAQARTRYNIFARQAEFEDLLQIARIFDETAQQEYEHAHRFFKFFNGGELEIAWHFPAGVTRDTYHNLLAAADLELYVHGTMYRRFAELARVEGFGRAADTFAAISVAERQHEKMYRELARNLLEKSAFQRAEEQVWRCLSCGYLHRGKNAPEQCPACARTRGAFELFMENW